MKLAPKLQPFWFTPAFQTEDPPVRFQLRPLTNQQMIDVEELYEIDRENPRVIPRWTDRARFHAGMLSIVACDGIFDDGGEPIRWPLGIEHTKSEALRDLICQCGLRMIVEMTGRDWEAMIKAADEKWQHAGARQPAEDDASKT